MKMLASRKWHLSIYLKYKRGQQSSNVYIIKWLKSSLLHSCSKAESSATKNLQDSPLPPCLLLLAFFQAPNRILAAVLKNLGNPVLESVVCRWQSNRKLGFTSSDVVSPCFCVGMIILFQIEFYLSKTKPVYQASVGKLEDKSGSQYSDEKKS